MRKILLHICCSPCSPVVLEFLKENNFDITGFWYNPNIHRRAEYNNRLRAVNEFYNYSKIKVVYNDYEWQKWFSIVSNAKRERCKSCYRMRLERLARFSKDNDFEYISTTLLASPYQKHSDIKKIGEEIGIRYGLNFFYYDVRNQYNRGKNLIRYMGLYTQKFCGCVFSAIEKKILTTV